MQALNITGLLKHLTAML